MATNTEMEPKQRHYMEVDHDELLLLMTGAAILDSENVMEALMTFRESQIYKEQPKMRKASRTLCDKMIALHKELHPDGKCPDE